MDLTVMAHQIGTVTVRGELSPEQWRFIRRMLARLGDWSEGRRELQDRGLLDCSGMATG